MVSLGFFIDVILSPAQWPEGKGGLRGANNLTSFMCRLSKNSGSLKLLETSGPIQAYTGIALPLPLPFCTKLNFSHALYRPRSARPFLFITLKYFKMTNND
jgi:hypothetical protein